MATNINEPWADCIIQEFKKLSDEELYKLRYGSIEDQIKEDIHIVSNILADKFIEVKENNTITLTLQELLEICYKFMNDSDNI